MKKYLIAGLAALSVATATVPAQAGNPWPFIGGVVGGLILSEALNNHHDYYHGPRPSYYYYDDDGYYNQQPLCIDHFERVYDPYLNRYVTRRIRHCE